MTRFSLIFLLILASPSMAADWGTVGGIRDEGFHNGQALELLEELCDDIGPRITNSPGHEASVDWVMDKFREWELDRVRDHEFEFGRGWSWKTARCEVVEPWSRSLACFPLGWTPGTEGPIRGEIMLAEIESVADFDSLRGKVEGKILFIDEPRELDLDGSIPFKRHSEDSLEELCSITPPERNKHQTPSKFAATWKKRIALVDAFGAFCEEEGVLAFVRISSRDHSVLRNTRFGNVSIDAPEGVPGLTITAESYNQICRMLDDDETVEMELEVDASFHSNDSIARNAIGEIAGKGKEIVIASAHLDSWHGATGATDNGAGVVVVMEAMRILKSLGIQPKRSIRAILWGGEEQGLKGSFAYNSDFVAERPYDESEADMPLSRRRLVAPIQPLKEHGLISAVYNIDNGAGRIRGIYAQENMAAVPIFRDWLEPFADLGANTVTTGNTGSTDHIPFDRNGVPGFQFVQDALQYFPRTHHSMLDVFEQVPGEDLKQSAVILAAFLWETAQRDDRMPRKPMPKPDPLPADESDDSADGDEH